MKLIVGLGNPGIEYQFTPHNMGFLTVDRLASAWGVEVRNRQCRALTGRAVVGAEQVLLAKPETYMNLSGLAVRDLASKNEISIENDLILIYDELDLPWGTIRIRQRGGSAGHNGIQAVIGALGTQEFLRIRVGVAPERKVVHGAAYLLSALRNAQLEMAEDGLERAAEAVKLILQDGAAAAMNRFNRRAEAEQD